MSTGQCKDKNKKKSVSALSPIPPIRAMPVWRLKDKALLVLVEKSSHPLKLPHPWCVADNMKRAF